MDLDRLIQEVNRITGNRLERSDPILAASVINEILLDQALAKLDKQVKLEADRVTAASTQILMDAKAAADLIVTQAGEWAEARIKAAGEAASTSVLLALQQETAKAERASRNASRFAWAAAALGGIILSGLAGMALASLHLI